MADEASYLQSWEKETQPTIPTLLSSTMATRNTSQTGAIAPRWSLPSRLVECQQSQEPRELMVSSVHVPSPLVLLTGAVEDCILERGFPPRALFLSEERYQHYAHSVISIRGSFDGTFHLETGQGILQIPVHSGSELGTIQSVLYWCPTSLPSEEVRNDSPRLQPENQVEFSEKRSHETLSLLGGWNG